MHNISPEKIIDMAQKSNCIGIAFTYNEPTIFGEYVLDIATLAHQSGLQTVMVTNGYITPEAIDDIYPFIDAANIDLKSFSNEFYRQYCKGELQPVLDAIQRIRDLGTFIEITMLIIPDKNDSDSELDHLTQWIVDNLGQDVPVHFSAFHPDYKMRQLTQTPKETLDKARKIAIRNGLRYVYEGNVLAENEDNTYCYHCGRLLIERRNFSIIKNKLEGDICSCGSKIAVVQS
jgi:pyruvate formate lyase activating enzyme